MKKTPGYVQIYTGEGKGKTTAAMGLALRASGAGWKTCFIQFLKNRPVSELKPLQHLPGLILQRFGRGGWVKKPNRQDQVLARAGLRAVQAALESGAYDLVIADEVCTACQLGLLSEEEILVCMGQRPAGVELVLTGHGATARMKRAADLVTEMRPVKHYYEQGVVGRKGIEY